MAANIVEVSRKKVNIRELKPGDCFLYEDSVWIIESIKDDGCGRYKILDILALPFGSDKRYVCAQSLLHVGEVTPVEIVEIKYKLL